ncbi:hypothetical protein MKW94_003560, partial [Papaver nudicaule]|nr:hypothetical protein [Papaver nudicaule]
NRDRFVMGEGAGVLLLGELKQATFLGGSFASDAYHMTETHPEFPLCTIRKGIILCTKKALAQSGVS